MKKRNRLDVSRFLFFRVIYRLAATTTLVSAAATLVSTTMGSFAAFATYLGHVLAVLTDGLATLTSDLALLVGRHSGETALATAAALVSTALVATLATALIRLQ
jgi:hypothetical protein